MMTEEEKAAALNDLPSWLTDPVPELDPELQSHFYQSEVGLGWPVIKHPLVFAVPYTPQMNARYNAQFAWKKQCLIDYREARNWSGFINAHERPYRIEGFHEIEGEMTDTEYWENLAWMWRDSENIRECYEEWEELITSQRPGRDHLMSEEELIALADMPDTFTVFQGHTDERDDGWSWTTHRPTAIWFGRRFANLEGGSPMITTAKVARADVVAYFLQRGEHEILVDPALVADVDTRPIAAHEEGSR